MTERSVAARDSAILPELLASIQVAGLARMNSSNALFKKLSRSTLQPLIFPARVSLRDDNAAHACLSFFPHAGFILAQHVIDREFGSRPGPTLPLFENNSSLLCTSPLYKPSTELRESVHLWLATRFP